MTFIEDKYNSEPGVSFTQAIVEAKDAYQAAQVASELANTAAETAREESRAAKKAAITAARKLEESRAAEKAATDAAQKLEQALLNRTKIEASKKAHTIDILKNLQNTCLEKVKNEIIAQNEKNPVLEIQKPITLEEITELFGDKLPIRKYKKKPSYMDRKNNEYMISFFDDFKQSYKPLNEIINDNNIYKELLLDIVTLNYEIYLLNYNYKELQKETTILRENLIKNQIKELKQVSNKNIRNLNQLSKRERERERERERKRKN